MKLQIVNNSPFENPNYSGEGNSGLDLKADFTDRDKIRTYSGKIEVFPKNDKDELKEIEIWPGTRCIIPTSIKIQLPKDHEAQIRPKSGQTLKKGFIVAFGTVDESYIGEIGVIVINDTDSVICIEHGEKVAQMVIKKVEKVSEWENVKGLDVTKRGEGGFGSTGIK